MSRNEMMTTAVGWAATKPKEITAGTDVPFTSFRLATTPRFFDSRRGGWVDGRTEFMTVKVFRDQALNVALSIDKGDPVIAYGRMRTEEWTSEGVVRTSLVIEASAVGHDLARGTSDFVRVRRTAVAGDAVGDGTPSPEEDPWAVDARPAVDGPAEASDGAGEAGASDGEGAGDDRGRNGAGAAHAEVEAVLTP